MSGDIPLFWRNRRLLSYLLLPLSIVFALIVWLRRYCYRVGVFSVYRAKVPVIVIGNITVGGNGKTPLVIALAQALTEHSYTVGVVSRGYGGDVRAPTEVKRHSLAAETGDEALLIARQTQAKVFVGKSRAKAVQALLQRYPAVDVVLSDDGLQHYALYRDIELAVIARDMGIGNGFLLPAGALREAIARLQTVDYVLLHGQGDFTLQSLPYIEVAQHSRGLRMLNGDDYLPVSDYTTKQPLYALTAIARPQRFFQALRSSGLLLEECCALADHADITPEDAAFAAKGYLIITEKDAVKTDNWSDELRARTMVLGHELCLPQTLLTNLLQRLDENNG